MLVKTRASFDKAPRQQFETENAEGGRMDTDGLFASSSHGF